MTDDDISFTVVDTGAPEARAAMAGYFTELDQRLSGGFAPGSALDDAATAFNPPAGLFLLATLAGVAVGCGAVHRLDDTTAEIKRMWVGAHLRGIGLGARLLGRLEAEARDSGCTRIVLDTNEMLVEAIALYRRSGYHEIEPYNDNPHAQHWFEKHLH